MWLTILAVILVGILVFAWWLGIFSKMEISEEIFQGGTFLYIDWKDEIRNINAPFKKLDAELR